MSTAVVTTASPERLDHLQRQQRFLAEVAPDAQRVVVWLDAEPPALPGATVVEHPPGRFGRRVGGGRNAGADRALVAGADLLVFLDADCLPTPGLLRGYEAAAGYPGLLSGPVTYLPEGLLPDAVGAARALVAPHPARPAPSDGAIQPATPEQTDLFWSLSFACTPDTWRRLGGFDEGYEGYGAEDTDLAWRARELGMPMQWVGGAHALHQYHPTSSPPWQHVDDILRNGARFNRRWGVWPMRGWLDAFAEAGVIRRDGDGWERAA